MEEQDGSEVSSGNLFQFKIFATAVTACVVLLVLTVFCALFHWVLLAVLCGGSGQRLGSRCLLSLDLVSNAVTVGFQDYGFAS